MGFDFLLNKLLVRVSYFAGGFVISYLLFRNHEDNSKSEVRAEIAAGADKKTKGETNNPYEEVKSVYEYLTFNYGGPDVNCVFKDLRPYHGYDFPKVTADICLEHAPVNLGRPMRALDIGCAVGRAAFELTNKFEEVVGIDFSHHFIKVCNELKINGLMNYEVLVEGSLTSKHKAVVPAHLDRSKCHFEQGDACNLSEGLGKFDCVLAGNLICRLPHPAKFLSRLSSLVTPGGICVITSPYTFLEDYTNKSNWLGGYEDGEGNEVRGLGTMKDIMSRGGFELIHQSDLPFMIRETRRKHQWTVADVTVWKKQ